MPQNNNTSFEVVIKDSMTGDVSRGYGSTPAEAQREGQQAANEARANRDRQLAESHSVAFGMARAAGSTITRAMDVNMSPQELSRMITEETGAFGAKKAAGFAATAMMGPASQLPSGQKAIADWEQLAEAVYRGTYRAMEQNNRMAEQQARGDLRGIVMPLASAGVPEDQLQQIISSLGPAAAARAQRMARANELVNKYNMPQFDNVDVGEVSARTAQTLESTLGSTIGKLKSLVSPGQKK